MKTDAIEETAKEEKDEQAIPEAEAKAWKAKILAINDKKLLTYIEDLVRARLDLGKADFNLHKIEKKATSKGVESAPYDPSNDFYSNKNIKLKPLNLPIEKENYDEAGS